MRARLRPNPCSSFVEDVVEIAGIVLERKAGLARSTQWAHACFPTSPSTAHLQSENRNFLFYSPVHFNKSCCSPGKKPGTRVAKSAPNVFCNDGLDELTGLFQPKCFYDSITQNLSLVYI